MLEGTLPNQGLLESLLLFRGAWNAAIPTYFFPQTVAKDTPTVPHPPLFDSCVAQVYLIRPWGKHAGCAD